MSWQQILQSDAASDEPLATRIAALFAQQRAAWPALAEGEAALGMLKTQRLTEDGASVVVQANPARRRSTLAKVDARAVASRPCFLCPANMPAEERGIAWRDLVIVPNPFPILPRHCTVPGRDHVPQRLDGNVGSLLALAAAVGPEMAAFYNGPKCGASAPDHFHFQACSAAPIPVLNEVQLHSDGHYRAGYISFGRSVLAFASQNADDVQADVEQSLVTLRKLWQSEKEPMVNLLVHVRDGRHLAMLFPRGAHRPRRYFAEGAERLAVSPAALEMAGILVVAEAEQIDRVDTAVAREIYEDVSLDRGRFEQLVGAVT
jgi:uncharacterized protein DUF4922